MNDRRPPADTTRRRLLRAIGGGALVSGMAGCSQLEGDEGETTDDPSPTTSTDTEAETEESTPTEGAETDDETTPDGETDGDGDGDDGDDEQSEDADTAGIGACRIDASIDDDCEEPVELSGPIGEDTTIGEDCSEYTVPGTVDVQNGATLTIRPGTRLTFAQGGQLWVNENSALSAAGTCEDPIVFTGEQETRGYWDGIGFSNADQIQSELSYCVVEYAGGNEYAWAPQPSNVVVFNGSRVSVDHCLIRESDGYGVALSGDSRVDSFEQNALTANASGPAWTTASSAAFLSETSAYAGNDVDRAVIADGTVTDDATWDGIDAEYFVTDGSTIGVEAALTIDPGATIAFGQDASMNVREGNDAVGHLTAVGMHPATEEVDPITFTGDQRTRGYWQGLLFNNSDQVPNELYHCEIEYAGSSVFSFENYAGNVVAKNGSRIDVRDTVIRESDGYGLVAHWGDEPRIDSFYRNEVTANASGAVFTTTAVAGQLDDDSTYAGNDVDTVDVKESTVAASDTVEWDALDARYRVLPSATLQIEGTLEVAPGAVVSFDQNAAVRIPEADSAGALAAVGEADDEITFTGEQETPGYWQGIKIDGSDNADNQLRHCVIEYAGSESFAFVEEAGAVAPVYGARVRIDDCAIRHNDGYGVVALGGETAIDSFANNDLTDNAAGAAYTIARVAGSLDDSSSYSDNGADVVDVKQSGVPTGETVEWDALDARYRVLAAVTLQIAGTLRVAPGAVVSFDQNAAVRIHENDRPGALTAVGTADDEITFTGEQETAGYWQGLKFDGTDNADNQLHHCVIEYGGGEEFAFTPAPGNVVVASGSRLSLADATLKDSGGYGLVVTGDGNQVSTANVTFAGNQSGDRR